MKLPADPGARVWPNAAQELLLHAALGSGEEVAKNFLAWFDMVDVEGPVDEGTYRTLPLLWSNLSRHGVDHPFVPRLKGIFRNSWVTATQQVTRAAELIAALQSEGIETMVSKGLPLAHLYYDRPAERPMNDIDIVVRSPDASRASRILESRGFETCRQNWQVEKALRHALMHKHPDRGEVDLHWHILFEVPNRQSDDHFWDAAVPMRLGEVECPRPAVSDMLLHVLVHGVRWNLSPPMRWIPDAMAILRSGESIDWDRIASFARTHRVSARTGLGLAYLRDRFGASVPDEVVRSLAVDPSLVERLESLAMRGSDARSGWRHLRRVTYVMRLLKSDDAARLPAGLAGEFADRMRGRLRRGRAAQRPGARGSRAS